MTRTGERTMARVVPNAAFSLTSSEQAVPWQVAGDRLSYARGGDWRIVTGDAYLYVPVAGYWALTWGMAVSSSQAEGTVIRGILDVAGTTVDAASTRFRASASQQQGVTGGTGAPVYVEPGEPIHLRGILIGGSTAGLSAPSYVGLVLEEGV